MAYSRWALARLPTIYRAAMRVSGRENPEKTAYLRLIKNGETVLDIGANTGYYTMLFSNIVGRRGHVHAFEPVAPTFDGLIKRYKAEGIYSNVTLNRLIVCRNDGEEWNIHLPGHDNGQASLVVHKAGSWARSDGWKSFTCETTSIDRYVYEMKPGRVDFVKIDVEGAELLVLEGARRTLASQKPKILFEFYYEWTRDFGYAAVDIIGLLTSLGYAHFYLDNLQPLSEPVTELIAKGYSVNVICAADALEH